MRFRAVLTVGVGVLFASCAAGNDSGGDGAAGESTTGATGARGGRGGSANGGTTDGGDGRAKAARPARAWAARAQDETGVPVTALPRLGDKTTVLEPSPAS